MNIIEKTREILMRFPKIDVIRTELADAEPESFGLSSIGDTLIREDILGNQTRRHAFMLYCTYSGINDYERAENSTALTELSQWLSTQTGEEVTAEIGSGEILTITAGNGRLYALPQGSPLGAWRYQLQIEVQYTINII